MEEGDDGVIGMTTNRTLSTDSVRDGVSAENDTIHKSLNSMGREIENGLYEMGQMNDKGVSVMSASSALSGLSDKITFGNNPSENVVDVPDKRKENETNC